MDYWRFYQVVQQHFRAKRAWVGMIPFELCVQYDILLYDATLGGIM
jgi:hypothetical protein